MNRSIFLFLLVLGVGYFSCNSSIQKQYLTQVTPIPASYEETPRVPGTRSGKRSAGCKDKSNYIPDPDRLEFTPLKIIKVNFHIMRNSEGGGNFPNKKMGRAYVKKVLDASNQKLTQNSKMFLPKENDTPCLPICYQYELSPQSDKPNDDGIYFHDDDELFFMNNRGKKKNIFTKDVYEKYGIQKDEVLNIFVMGVHPDSVTSKTYKMSSNGVAFGKWVKLASWFYFIKNKNWKTGDEFEFNEYWYSQRLLNHEIGHCLGLRHSWTRSDGCDDTPRHPNCWNYTKNGSRCDTEVSNNIMDYTAHAGAWTPCQIGITHYNMSNKDNRIRNLLKKTWCEFDEAQTIKIQSGEDITWKAAKDLHGNIIVKNKAKLNIGCRVSLPPNAKIIVEPKGQLILDGATLENDCGQLWKGIEVWTEGNDSGQVTVINDAKIVNVENEIKMVLD